jgi:hypothetical protein
MDWLVPKRSLNRNVETKELEKDWLVPKENCLVPKRSSYGMEMVSTKRTLNTRMGRVEWVVEISSIYDEITLYMRKRITDD